MSRMVIKKTILLIGIVSCLFLLSGCSFSDLMSWGTGVKNDPDYQTWEKLAENGKLNSRGEYTADAVHVTFSKNNFLDIHYFSDPDMTNEIPETGCYLLPGDSLYYTVSAVNSSEGIYFFDHLEVIEYSDDNIRKGKANWNNSDAAVLMIPYDYKGTEISIEPAGHFGSRQLILQALSTSGNSITGGTWYVDNEEVTAGTISVNALNSYNVEYRYDSDKYYLMSANPAPWKTDEGIVVFETSDAQTGTEKYEITLETYASANVSVKSGGIDQIPASNDLVIVSKKDTQTLTVSKIRSGSKITIQTDSGDKNNIAISCPLRSKINDPSEQNSNDRTHFEYVIEFGDVDRFMFIPSEYSYPHGMLEFFCNGTIISEPIALESGWEITYKAKTVDDGYWLPDGGGTIVVNGFDTASELHKISFYPIKTVSVLFPQPATGGSIVYSTAEELLETPSADLLCGTKVYADFNADKGWESQILNHFTYVVPDANNQAVSFGNYSVNEVFKENEGHKPELTVSIHQNLGPCKTNISTSDAHWENLLFNGGNNIFDAFKTVIQGEKISTAQGIVFTFTNFDLPNENNALRITVNKETKNGNFKEVYYVNKANSPLTVSLDKEKEYTAIKVQIESIKADVFSMISVSNADVSVQFTDVTPDSDDAAICLTDGVLVSGERQIEIAITPHEGFFMDGANTKNDVYARRMSYDEYKKLSVEEIEKQRKKICNVDLLTEDDYGTVEFFVDGQSTEGQIAIREGKEIVLKYSLNDESYEIVGDRDIFTQAASLVDSSVSRKIEVRIKVDSELDGKSLRREDVIEIQKKVTE